MANSWILADNEPSDINALILDYLTMEGYPQAAANFSKEANLNSQQDKSFVHTRQQIRSAIHNGKIDEAITLLNHFNPEVSIAVHYLVSLPFLPSCLAMIIQRFMHHS